MLYAERRGDKLITVDMGSPLLRWEEIPIARAMDTAQLDFEAGGFDAPGAVNMGNPHVDLLRQRRARRADRNASGRRSSTIRCSRSG